MSKSGAKKIFKGWRNINFRGAYYGKNQQYSLMVGYCPFDLEVMDSILDIAFLFPGGMYYHYYL